MIVRMASTTYNTMITLRGIRPSVRQKLDTDLGGNYSSRKRNPQPRHSQPLRSCRVVVRREYKNVR
jgi:hypothetical protein